MKRKRNHHIYLSFLLLLTSAASSFGQIRLPRLISDGMILQREADITVWGWAAKNEAVVLQFRDSTYRTVANDEGRWRITLPPSPPGGPYDMVLTASNVVRINDIMFGDVWVCAGQSNMELPMRRVSPIYEADIASSENRNIRQFLVPQGYNFTHPQEDLPSGSWKHANPENVLNFSAVAYFFARDLYQRYGIPIGLINASLGGSPAEAWMSEGALKAFPRQSEEGVRFRDSSLIRRIEREDNERIGAWYALLQERDAGRKPGRRPWFDPAVKTVSWKQTRVPGYWEDGPIEPLPGVVWLRREFTLSAAMAGAKAKLDMGRIVDADSVFLNGICVGTTSYQYPPRRYVVPEGVLRPGNNVIVVRVINTSPAGGFVPDKQYVLTTKDTTINLTGIWRYRRGATMEPLAGQTFVRWKPMGLHNAMLAPLFNVRIAGVIWYQGESNASQPLEYRTIFPALIRDWRQHWNQGPFPFLYVQLPNFLDVQPQPSEGGWALLRESQLMTLSEPNCAMAVTIDVGEWNDIHPLNKFDVGKRLALAARRLAYGEGSTVASGPMYHSMRIEADSVVLSFTETGSGLTAKGGGKLRSFAVAGVDRKFVWAQARIEGETVIVWNDDVPDPVAVRYGWANNPEGANLFNKEGLPASPFRTDDWIQPQ